MDYTSHRLTEFTLYHLHPKSKTCKLSVAHASSVETVSNKSVQIFFGWYLRARLQHLPISLLNVSIFSSEIARGVVGAALFNAVRG